MLRGALDGGGQSEHLFERGSRSVGKLHTRDGGTTFGQGSGLVDDDGVDLLHPFQRFGVLDQHAVRGTPPDPDLDADRCRQAECAGASDDQNCHRDDQPVREPGVRSDQQPHHERQHRDANDRGHEDPGHPIGHPLDRRPRALRFGDQGHDPRQHRVLPDSLCLDHQGAGRVNGAPDDRVADILGDRHRLAGHQRLIQRGTALDHHPVRRHLLAGTHAEPISRLNLLQAHLLFGAVGGDPPGGRGG